jgi:hypothetical protein
MLDPTRGGAQFVHHFGLIDARASQDNGLIELPNHLVHIGPDRENRDRLRLPLARRNDSLVAKATDRVEGVGVADLPALADFLVESLEHKFADGSEKVRSVR